jgi:hypothetical protein
LIDGKIPWSEGGNGIDGGLILTTLWSARRQAGARNSAARAANLRTNAVVAMRCGRDIRLLQE